MQSRIKNRRRAPGRRATGSDRKERRDVLREANTEIVEVEDDDADDFGMLSITGCTT
jgi:hypothetical protein